MYAECKVKVKVDKEERVIEYITGVQHGNTFAPHALLAFDASSLLNPQKYLAVQNPGIWALPVETVVEKWMFAEPIHQDTRYTPDAIPNPVCRWQHLHL
jgi:hypothetical protein